MKKIILFFVFMLSISIAYALTTGCGDEVEISTPCIIRTPPITCSTYDIYNGSNNISVLSAPMEEIISTGVHNFTFTANSTGIHTIVLCDNTSTQLLVQNTDKTDLATILSNQATLQDNIMTVNDTVKNINTSILRNLSLQHGEVLTLIGNINTSIILNLSNDFGFFGPMLNILNNSIVLRLNTSILRNISLSTFTSSVSPTDVLLIGMEAARQVLKQNLTIFYGYNRTSFAIINVSYNYSSLGIYLNESFGYDNDSYLVNVTRVEHLG